MKNNSIIKRFPPQSYWLNASIFLIWLVGLSIALFSPEHVLDEFQLLNSLIKFENLIIPVTQYSSHSSYPQVALLFNSFVMMFLPFYLLHGWRFWRYQKTGGLASRLHKDIKRFNLSDYFFLILLVIPLFGFLGFGGLYFWNGADSRLFLIGSSRLQMGIFGFFIPFYCCYFISGAVLAAKKVMLGKI